MGIPAGSCNTKASRQVRLMPGGGRSKGMHRGAGQEWYVEVLSWETGVGLCQRCCTGQEDYMDEWHRGRPLV